MKFLLTDTLFTMIVGTEHFVFLKGAMLLPRAEQVRLAAGVSKLGAQQRFYIHLSGVTTVKVICKLAKQLVL